MKKNDLHRIVTIGLLCAMAFVAVLLSHMLPPVIPILPFLKYDAKDVIIVIGGFIYDPFAAVIISVVVSLIEMFTISSTGFYGLIMNVFASLSFAVTASLIYKTKRTMKRAVIGLISAVAVTSAVMLLWNLIITPLYMHQSVTSILIPYILPFNVFKATVNASLTIALYKPIVTALRKTKLVPSSEHKPKLKESLIGILIAVVLIGLSLLLIFKVNGII